MGTRADFYVGKGKKAEWLGSIAWDGYRDGIADDILDARSERNFREAVTAFLKSRDDATFPEQGWPWPWKNSCTTDCAYAFADGACHEFSWGRPVIDGEDVGEAKADWPDMSDRKNVTLGKRSGTIVLIG